MPSRATGSRHSALRLVPAAAAAAEPITDEELLAAVQRGENRAPALLYDRLYVAIDQTLFRVFGRREADHADLVQTAFEQVVLTLSRRSYARACNLETWAASISSHVGFNALRSRHPGGQVPDRGADRVRCHFLAIEPERAETVFLHDVLGHQLAEVALIMRVSIAAATARLVRGRRELYRRIDRETQAERR